MLIHPGLALIPHFPQGCALTIGNFDGVHSGHKKILKSLHQSAKQRHLPTVLMIFEPQPQEYFARLNQCDLPVRLTPLRDKLTLLEATNCLDHVWVARFNAAFAAMNAEEFIERVLKQHLNVRYLLIGDDFRFGHDRRGDFTMLSTVPDFTTEQIESVLLTGNRISSTAARQALLAGDLVRAQEILGHDYSLAGRVMHGHKLGRTLGCPTANIYLPPHRYPLQGVFVVEVVGSFGRRAGVASFGFNPTVNQSTKPRLEVHIFDWHQEIYGQRLRIYFKHKLRDEMKFTNLGMLQQAIFTDMHNARAWWQQHSSLI